MDNRKQTDAVGVWLKADEFKPREVCMGILRFKGYYHNVPFSYWPDRDEYVFNHTYTTEVPMLVLKPYQFFVIPEPE